MPVLPEREREAFEAIFTDAHLYQYDVKPGLLDYESPYSNLWEGWLAHAALTHQAPERQRAFEQECKDVDELLWHLGLRDEQCRTEAGYLNLPRIKSLLAEAEEKKERQAVPETLTDSHRIAASISLGKFPERVSDAEVIAWRRSLPAAPTEDAKDARRYRWLRERFTPMLCSSAFGRRVDPAKVPFTKGWGAELDAAIDHALSASAEGEK